MVSIAILVQDAVTFFYTISHCSSNMIMFFDSEGHIHMLFPMTDNGDARAKANAIWLRYSGRGGMVI